MSRRGARGRGGFTLIELVVVLTVSAVLMSVAGLSLGRYFGRTSARRAAQLFAQDLTLARQFAVRSREPVVVRFHEATLRYEIVGMESGATVATRRFLNSDGVDLSVVTLELAGDSLVFDRRGFADLSGAGGPLGQATFSSGSTGYTVSFNGLGASKVEAS